MSNFRRMLMALSYQQQDYTEYGYIRDGLVFHLDGINKGPNEGKWTDLIGGVEFENHNATPTYDGWLLINESSNTEPSQYLIAKTSLNYPTNSCTIEASYIPYNTESGLVFYSGHRNSVAIGYSTFRYNFVYSIKPYFRQTNKYDIIKKSPYTISAANDVCLINKVSVETNSLDGWIFENIQAIIGGRFEGIGQLNGKIYSIRIYNRLLTEEEMRHNQEVDYARFDLANIGKTILLTSTSDSVELTINGVKKTYSITPNVPNKIVIEEKVTSLNSFISGQNEITELDLSNFDTSNVTSMLNAFFQTSGHLRRLILNGVNTLNVTNFGNCFRGNNELTSLDLSSFDFGKATNVGYMFFSNFGKITDLKFGKNLKRTIDLSYQPLSYESALSVINGLAEVTEPQRLTFRDSTWWTLCDEDIEVATSKGWIVTEPANIEGKVVGVKSSSTSVALTINGINRTFDVTPNKTNRLFIDETITSFGRVSPSMGISYIDIATLDTSSITNMNDAFYTYMGTELDLSKNNLNNVTNLLGCFRQCINLKHLDLSNFNMGKVTSIGLCFTNCNKLSDLKFGYNLKISTTFGEVPLSHESALSVINGLAEVTTTQTLTFKDVTYDTLTEEEIALATSKGWSVVSA